jgi:Leucine-rich repeat (LRR) protein
MLGSVPELTLLDMSNNSISALVPDLFANNTELGILILSKNYITVIPNGLLDPLTRLTYLDLSFNRFDTLYSNVFENSTIILSLFLYGNPIKTIQKSAFLGLDHLMDLGLNCTGLPASCVGGFLFGRGSLTTIEPGAMFGLNMLSYLRLAYVRIYFYCWFVVVVLIVFSFTRMY